MLSAQATDVSVNQATKALYAAANTPQALLDMGLETLKSYVKSIRLFNTPKAANILKTCCILIDQHGGEVPRSREALEALPGVGRKTANVVLNTTFGEPTIPSTRTASECAIAPASPPARRPDDWKTS